jgi:hypothetical protein
MKFLRENSSEDRSDARRIYLAQEKVNKFFERFKWEALNYPASAKS